MMFDHMMYDGLEDAYSRNEKTGEGRSMGTFAEVLGQVRIHPRSAGQLRHRIGQARTGRHQRRLLQLGNRPSDRHLARWRHRHRQR
jgi:hypothetical protein